MHSLKRKCPDTVVFTCSRKGECIDTGVFAHSLKRNSVDTVVFVHSLKGEHDDTVVFAHSLPRNADDTDFSMLCLKRKAEKGFETLNLTENLAKKLSASSLKGKRKFEDFRAITRSLICKSRTGEVR